MYMFIIIFVFLLNIPLVNIVIEYEGHKAMITLKNNAGVLSVDTEQNLKLYGNVYLVTSPFIT